MKMKRERLNVSSVFVAQRYLLIAVTLMNFLEDTVGLAIQQELSQGIWEMR